MTRHPTGVLTASPPSAIIRRVRPVAAVVVLSASLIACGGGDDPRAVPVRNSAARPPGTPVADGFTVAEGSVMIGAPLPIGVAYFHRGEPVVDGGWLATMYVSGEPARVLEAYLRQAEALGFRRRPVVPEPGREATSRVATCALDDSALYRCVAAARRRDGGEPRTVLVDVARRDLGGGFASQLTLRYSTLEVSYEHGDWHAFGDPAAPAPAPPEEWPPLPEPGDPIGPPWPQAAELRVLPGTELAAQPGLDTDCTQVGTALTFASHGDAHAVIAAYGRQFHELLGLDGPVVPAALTIDADTTLLTFDAAQSGGDSFSARLVDHARDDDWLRVTTCHD
jgi:hypothetical protein